MKKIGKIMECDCGYAASVDFIQKAHSGDVIGKRYKCKKCGATHTEGEILDHTVSDEELALQARLQKDKEAIEIMDRLIKIIEEIEEKDMGLFIRDGARFSEALSRSRLLPSVSYMVRHLDELNIDN